MVPRILDISLGVDERMFLGSWWNMERGEVVVDVFALGAERSMALEMLGTSDLGSDGVVGFLGSQLDFDSLEAAVLVWWLTEIETAA